MKCATKNCTRDAEMMKVNGKMTICKRCYAYIWWWMKQGPAKAHKHSIRLQRREELLDSAMGSTVRRLVRRAA